MVNSMTSRMERYNSENLTSEDNTNISRVNKNASLYQDIKTSELSRVRDNNNIKVIESNGKTIDIDKIKRYIENNNLETKPRRSVVTLDNDTTIKEPIKREEKSKDYDINSVLEKAKRGREIDYERERYKKLRDTQYDILSKINMYQEKEEKELEEEIKEEFNTDERTLIDLINTVTIHKGDINLLDELVGGEGETTLPIEEEIEKRNFEVTNEEPVIIQVDTEEIKEDNNTNLEQTQELVNLKEKTMELDKSFYTNSMSFSKSDFEGFNELEKSVKKNSILSTITIVLIVVFILITLLIVSNYVFDLGLF